PGASWRGGAWWAGWMGSQVWHLRHALSFPPLERAAAGVQRRLAAVPGLPRHALPNLRAGNAGVGGGGAPSVAKAWHAGPGCAPRAGRKPPEGRDTPALQLVTSEIIPECAMATPANQLPARQSNATPLRFVTAASLFDGHDAAINIMRRLIQAQGAEVIHLGHNRSVEDVVRAALQEDADAI